MFVPGRTYRRRDLHEMYGGQRQGGISTPAQNNLIILFTGEQGQEYGYRDKWTEEGLFLFTGEGQRGDMSFVRGNRAIRDHTANGKDLHLFEYVRRGHVRYIGQMVCTGFLEHSGRDVDSKERQVIVFELTPINAFDPSLSIDDIEDEEIWSESLEALRERAVASATVTRTPVESRSIARYRSNAIRVYVLRRADGICEACGSDAPFRNSLGQPYLEPHHIRRLSDGGPDHPEWVIALCPNCHRKAHYAEDKDEFDQQLTSMVKDQERGIDV